MQAVSHWDLFSSPPLLSHIAKGRRCSEHFNSDVALTNEPIQISACLLVTLYVSPSIILLTRATHPKQLIQRYKLTDLNLVNLSPDLILSLTNQISIVGDLQPPVCGAL